MSAVASGRRRRVLAAIGAGLALCAAVLLSMGAGSALLTSCTTTPTAVPVRTFERAQKVDVVCMQVLDQLTGALIQPIPGPQSKCAPVPAGIDGTYLPFHLFALVTQLGRGEVAVVDLTQGTVVDIDQATPGFNFHVVGKNPTDVAVTPDGLMTFVAAAEINKPAIYALRNDQILGDWQGAPGSSRPKITNWPACALPQVPDSIAIVPTRILGTAPVADAGSTDAGSTDAGSTDAGEAGTATDAGVAAVADALGYEVVAVLPGDARTSAKVVTIDPRPFLRGASLVTDAGPEVAPGSLAPCPITSAIELANGSYAPRQVQPGPAWDDGIKYVDGGAPAEEVPNLGTAVCAAGNGFTADAGLPIDAPSDLAARGGTAALSGQIYYVADAVLPLIHAIDLRNGAMKELPPLLATSITDPSRRVTISQIAVSPPTREFKRYLYAIDAKEGTLMVYDVTDPDTSSRLPLTRPHPETNPFQAEDRISFSSPVATLSFARNEWPLSFDVNATGAALTGLLCNPNPNAGTALDDAGLARDLGVFYRANSPLAIGPPGISGVIGPSPYRLRGIFGFATLTTGAMVAIDVDDWDAPCRRPDPMGTLTQADGGAPILDNVTSSITPPEPAASSSNDRDPYHASRTAENVAANVYSAPTTLEGFFPVSAPHRSRSLQYLRNDPSLGNHLPRIDVLPQLFVNDAIQAASASETRVPILLPTKKGGLADPNEATLASDPNPARATVNLPSPNVRFSFESPEVHLDQDWTITYEGKGPSVKGLAGAVSTTDGYKTLTITTDQGLFCRRGVEDFRVGQEKAAQIKIAAAAQGLLVPDRLDHKIADYVQLKEDILPNDDPYWGLNQECWNIPDPTATDPNHVLPVDTAQRRYDACATTFGSGEDVNPDMSVQRDFPVLAAYQDHLVIGRYGYPSGQTASTSSREVVSSDAGNVAFLKLAQCCFHNQVQFNVRTGGEWVAQGAKNGFLHHVTEGAGGQCVLSCNARDALLNARAPVVSQVKADGSDIMSTLVDSGATPIGRNLPLAMRNPMFSFYVVNGYLKSATVTGGQSPFTDILPLRDSQWRFTTRGQFQPLFINLASTTTAVSPQSMKFIDSLGQVAIVDGEAQGLMLVDLNVLALSHSPYY